MAVCRGCKVAIGWTRLKGGAAHPVQTEEPQLWYVYTGPRANAGKRVVLITEEGEVVHVYLAPAGKGIPVKAFESHFPHCPEAEALRRPRTKPPVL